MRPLLTALVFLLAAPAAADGLPVWVDRGVPDPVPVGYDRCVVVAWNEMAQAKFGSHGVFLDPPLSQEDVRFIQTTRLKGDGVIRHCDEKRS